MLLFIGIGDAFAAGVEYVDNHKNPELIKRALEFEEYVQHPTHSDLFPGAYTDDTEMSVANARVLVEHDFPYNNLMFADSYVREFLRGGGRKGYSRQFQSFLEGLKSGEEFLARINPNSNKNGAAMRAVPFGVLRTIGHVLEVAELQAKITHNTPEGIFSSRVVALMSHFSLYEDGPLSDLPDYCRSHLPSDSVKIFNKVFTSRWPNSAIDSRLYGSVAIATVHAAIDALTHQKTLLDMMRQIINWGGDTDTVAAIVWGIGSARLRNEEIPDFMESNLERGNENTGAKYLRGIGKVLMEKFQ